MSVQCIDCASADPKAAGAMARQGFARCDHKTAAQNVSLVYERQCDDYKPAAPGVATKRTTWLQSQRKPT